ncbi:hypothetical protein C8J57DRAFT_624565 [Mycena rebaudengoi]|nr:hypothetical protein C8J57DRAFT_624565 [Mycena rebaudengoi]
MFFKLWTFVYQAFLLLSLLKDAHSQGFPYDPSPFNFIGTIDSLTLNATGGVLAGGTITVDGALITVPENLLVTLPSITVAWSELFEGGVPALPLLGSVSWQATVFGNTVRGQRIAGLIYIVQPSARFLQGFITSINLANGHFTVGDVECVLNDPLGRFGPAYLAHPLWTVDPDNPSVRTSTGFPMCIPRNATDSECPSTNRPTDGNGKPLNIFTFKAPASVTAGDPDPRIMAPLLVGDFITFSGIKVAGGLLEVYSLEANLGFYTAPGTKPAYVTVEEAQYAVVSSDVTLESAETRAVAFVTDATTSLQWFAIDVDPCTGQTSERDLLLAQPEAAAPIGKSDFRLGKTDVSPVTRQVGFRYSSGTSPGPRGIIAGQFVQPIFDYIFPETTVFGANMPPNQLELFPYLAEGGGPFIPGNLLTPIPTTPTLVGQLKPWPGIPIPAAASCSSPPSDPPTPPTPDVIRIISATTQNGQGGVAMTSVTASTSSLTAQLFVALTGATNVPPQMMTNFGGGIFSLTITTKGRPRSVTVTSSEKGTPVTVAL